MKWLHNSRQNWPPAKPALMGAMLLALAVLAMGCHWALDHIDTVHSNGATEIWCVDLETDDITLSLAIDLIEHGLDPGVRDWESAERVDFASTAFDCDEVYDRDSYSIEFLIDDDGCGQYPCQNWDGLTRMPGGPRSLGQGLHLHEAKRHSRDLLVGLYEP